MRKTMHLSMVEDGAYTRLLDWYYANDRKIPNDRRYAIARASSAQERAAVDAVLHEFFVEADGQHRNERADSEIIAAAKRIEAARVNGGKGGRKPKQNPTDNPVGSDPLTQRHCSLSPNSLRSEEKGAIAPSSPAFADDQLAEQPEKLTCPQQRIRSLYAEVLPSLPQARKWDADRERALRSRWREQTTEKGWTTADEGVEWFRRFFEAVSENDWAMGRSGRSKGHENWECDIDYLLTVKGFRRIIESAGRVRESA
jgi:uncharacterized protein YdaU (DUF1376 family)